MTDSPCDVCGLPATVHLTEVRDDGKAERQLCEEHARVEGIPVPAAGAGGRFTMNGESYSSIADAMAGGIIDNLRGAVNFARRHGRMPATAEELKTGISSPDDVPATEIADPTVRAQVE